MKSLNIKIGCLCAAIVVSMSLCACDSSSSSSDNGSSSQINVAVQPGTAEIMTQLQSVAKNFPTSIATFGSDVANWQGTYKFLTDASADEVEEFSYVYSKEATADEIMIVKLKSESAANELEKKLSDRIDKRKKDFEGYAPEQVSRLDDAKISKCGVYVAFIVCDNASEVATKLKEIVK